MVNTDYIGLTTQSTDATKSELLTNSTEMSPSWEANGSLVSQQILHILWNKIVHPHNHKHMPLISVLS